MDGFYRAFEDKHRGSREQIKNRQRVYLPLVSPLALVYPGAQTIDLGCGRGEWLELLGELGFDARGVDLNDGMLQECRDRGLHVATEDALTALKKLPEASQAVVSGFHFAEHIPFDILQQVVQEALRVLRPAGLLILETPNPENIVVGSANFYLDPTHNRPLPPLLLEFLPEYCGFHRVKLLRLQEPVNLTDTRRLTIHDVLSGVSPDYAVVAQKAADPQLILQVSQAFALNYGVTLGAVSGRYEEQADQRLHGLLNDVHLILQETDRRISVLESKQQQYEASRPKARLKRVLKKVARRIDGAVKSFIKKHPAVHAKLAKFSRMIGLSRLINPILARISVVSDPSLKPWTDPEKVEWELTQEPAAVREAFRDLDAAIKKADKR
jgi:O-antigen chain-terminating methyltransferase